MGEALARSPYSSLSPKGDATGSLLPGKSIGILRQAVFSLTQCLRQLLPVVAIALTPDV
ncbi:MAG: hypothetical protein V7K18_19415 [Nostoc sp.]|uniref:hypothetical protein n=1 Tax=Nostoc sp. TaxID=1180 RepID=UPI002FF8FBBE